MKIILDLLVTRFEKKVVLYSLPRSGFGASYVEFIYTIQCVHLITIVQCVTQISISWCTKPSFSLWFMHPGHRFLII